MDIPLFKQFVLWRGDKRIVVGEEDLQTAKISSVFKVSTFYCKAGHNCYELTEATFVWLDFPRFSSFDPAQSSSSQKG